MSRIHRKKPADADPHCQGQCQEVGGACPAEHIFAEPKARIGLVVRTIGLARARTKIGLANLVDNMRRLLWLERHAVVA